MSTTIHHWVILQILCQSLATLCVLVNIDQFRAEVSTKIIHKIGWWLHHKAFAHECLVALVEEGVLPHTRLENIPVLKDRNDFFKELLVLEEVQHRIETKLFFAAVQILVL